MRTSAPTGKLRSKLTILTTLAALCATPAFAGPLEESGALTLDTRGVLTMKPLLEATLPGVVSLNTVDRELPDGSTVGGVGSGVILDATRGLVVTNHHVVEDAQSIRITTHDRRSFTATRIGSDPSTDLALLRIAVPSRLTEIPLASAGAGVGDYVVAIGNPFGLNSSVSSGIVSAVGREGDLPSAYTDFIQTDAAINPGNSGGALLNSRGELVGINSALVSKSGSSGGIGYAVPADVVRNVTDRLAATGVVRRGRIGVMIRSVSPERAAELGLPDLKGALLSGITAGGPASRAGLRRNDVVVGVGERDIVDSADLRYAVGLLEPGERVDVRYRRAGSEFSTRLTIGTETTTRIAEVDIS